MLLFYVKRISLKTFGRYLLDLIFSGAVVFPTPEVRMTILLVFSL
jgi:hypothetical protein